MLTIVLCAIAALIVPAKTTTALAAETGTYEKVTSTLSDWSGEYLIVYESGKVAFDGSRTTMDAVSNTKAVTISNNKIEADRSISFTIAKSGTSYTIKSASGYYIGQSSNANGLKSSTSTTYSHTISFNSDKSVNLVSGGAYLRYNSASDQLRFRYYKSSSYSGQKAIALYKYVEAAALECEHANVPTDGYAQLENYQHQTKNTCPDCQAVISGNAVNCEMVLQGNAYTCICGRNVPVNTITLMVNGEEYDVLETNGKQVVELPALTEGLGKYFFYGWTSEEISEEVTNKPAQAWEAGEQVFAESTTLHALYASGTPETWSLVTDVATLAEGQEVIIAAKTANYAMSTEQKDANRGAVAITKGVDNTAIIGDAVQVVTLKAGKSAGTFAFYTGSGYLYASSGSANQLKTQTTLDANGSWKITIASGTATIVAQGTNARNTMQYNPNSGNPLFACYASASQQALVLYAKAGGATGFTTTIAEEPAEPVEPAFDGATLSIGQTLDVNYYVVLPEAYEGATVDFAMGDITMSGVEGVAQEDGRYVYTFSGIAPQFMGDNIVATLYFDDEVIASMEEYSVKMYATNWLGKEIADDFREVLINLLAYGAAAQKYMNYNVENLVNAGYEVEEPATPDETDFTLTEAQQPAWFTSASVWFDNVNKICVRVSATEEVTLRVNGTDVEMESNVYYTEAIFATEFDETFTFELVVDGEVVQTLTYSVNAYAYAMQNNAKMAELATALYNYGVAADAYVS